MILTASSRVLFYLTGSYDDLVGKCTNTKTTRTQITTKTTNHTTEIYEYACFEKDVIWGYLSLAFMCVPGVFFWMFLSYKYSISIFKVVLNLVKFDNRTKNIFYISVCTKPIVGLNQDIPFWVIAILSYPFWECCHWLLPIQFCLWLSNLCLYSTMELNGRSWIVLWLCLKDRLRDICKWHCRLYFVKVILWSIN